MPSIIGNVLFYLFICDFIFLICGCENHSNSSALLVKLRQRRKARWSSQCDVGCDRSKRKRKGEIKTEEKSGNDFGGRRVKLVNNERRCSSQLINVSLPDVTASSHGAPSSSSCFFASTIVIWKLLNFSRKPRNKTHFACHVPYP